MNYLSSLKDWRILIVVIIIAIVILLLFLGGNDHEFIGFNVSDENSEESETDPENSEFSEYDSNKTLEQEYCRSNSPWDKNIDLEIDSMIKRNTSDIIDSIDNLNSGYLDKNSKIKSSSYQNRLEPNQFVSDNITRRPRFAPSNNQSPYIKRGTPGRNKFNGPPSNSRVFNSQTPSSQTKSPLIHIPSNSRIKPVSTKESTTLSTDMIKNMNVKVSLEEALATCDPKKNKAESRGESICREVFERIYRRPFPSTRPDFLKNPESGCNLELDGYCEELQIAFEYNGIQHYTYPNWIHKTEKDFEKQVRRDQYKIHSCEISGVYLISIPYTIPHNLIEDYIIYYLPENVQKRIDARSRGESIQKSYIEECGYVTNEEDILIEI